VRYLLTTLSLLLLPAAAFAADVHIDPQDTSGVPAFTVNQDGSSQIVVGGVTLKLTAAEKGEFADLVKPDPPPPAVGTEGDVQPFRPLQSNADALVTSALGGNVFLQGVQPFRPLQSNADALVTSALGGNVFLQGYLDRFDRGRVYMKGGGSSGWPADKAYAVDAPWFPRGWTYKDAMVASYYPATTTADVHLWDGPPTDANRKRLFINFQCNGTSCTQYAKDMGNPAARKTYIDNAHAQVAESGGLFIDDANFWMQRVVSDAAGAFQTPWNPRSGQDMTQDEWADGMLALVQESKAAFPDPAEVVINTVPFHGPGLLNIPQAKQALAVVDGWELERGFGDAGITASAFDQTFKPTVDYAHSVGTFVVHDVQSTAVSQTYALAAYLCLSSGRDFYGHPTMSPSSVTTLPPWNPQWDLNLGAATSSCTKGSDGIYRRSFERGSVTVKPQSKTGTIG
jgi:hypothetical protein